MHVLSNKHLTSWGRYFITYLGIWNSWSKSKRVFCCCLIVWHGLDHHHVCHPCFEMAGSIIQDIQNESQYSLTALFMHMYNWLCPTFSFGVHLGGRTWLCTKFALYWRQNISVLASISVSVWSKFQITNS